MPMSPLIVGVRFAQIGKVYHFDASSTPEIKAGDHVIVFCLSKKQIRKVEALFQVSVGFL